jgi:hypothetical protein
MLKKEVIEQIDNINHNVTVRLHQLEIAKITLELIASGSAGAPMGMAKDALVMIEKEEKELRRD